MSQSLFVGIEPMDYTCEFRLCTEIYSNNHVSVNRYNDKLALTALSCASHAAHKWDAMIYPYSLTLCMYLCVYRNYISIRVPEIISVYSLLIITPTPTPHCTQSQVATRGGHGRFRVITQTAPRVRHAGNYGVICQRRLRST